ncbi:hypothetical protein SLE2022_383250 [Rubroshorea leprosula]
MEDKSRQIPLEWLAPLEWLKNISEGNTTSKPEAITMEGLQIVNVQKGLIRCNFTVPSIVSDSDGNWQIGAMAALIDCVAGAAIHTTTVGHINVTLDFTISYHSAANIQDEVEIEAKVAGNRGRLTSVVVEVRNKKNRQLIASGKQWARLISSTSLKSNSKL